MRNVRHFQLRQLMKFLDPSFSPALRFDDEFLRTAFATPGVVACVHSQAEFAICAALDQVGVRTAFVSSTPVSQKELENYKFAVPPLNLLRGPDLFVQARAALKNGRAIVCDTDFILDKGLPGAKICISKSLFEFRRMLRLNLFFGHVRILEDGLMDCIFEAHRDGSTSAQQDAHSFIGFIERVSSPSTKLTIEIWRSSDTQIGAALRHNSDGTSSIAKARS